MRFSGQRRWFVVLSNPLYRIAIFCAISFAQTTSAIAVESYPTKSVRLVVPYTPGGGSDTVARIITQKMSDALGKTIVVDNRAGAAGTLGTEIVAHAQPDGYTLLLADSPFTINSLHKRARYDAQKSFVPVALIATTPYVLVVNPLLPTSTIRDFIALARAQPGKINLGSSGTGGGNHLTGELFKLKAAINLNHVPYKGAGPAIGDVMSGQIQATFASAPGAVVGVRNGRLKPLAVTSATRSSTLPDVPTFAELGFSDFTIVNWYGIMAPAGTPSGPVTRLYEEVTNALGLLDVQARLSSAALEPVIPATDQFRKMLAVELKRWAQVIESANIQIE